MKKVIKVIILMLLALLLLCSCAGVREGVWVCVKKTSWVEGADPELRGTRTYDENGRLIESFDDRFTDIGREKTWDSYVYNEAGQLIHSEYTRHEGVTESWTDYAYDEVGKLLRKESYESNGIHLTEEYEYREDGLLSVLYYRAYLSEEECALTTAWTQYRYDKNGNLIEEKTYRDGSLSSATENAYDANGNLTETVFRNFHNDGSGDITYWQTNEYDGQGNLLCRTEYYETGLHSTADEWMYDENGVYHAYTELEQKRRVQSILEQTYDAQGNCLTACQINQKGEIESQTSYSYDTQGNCQKSCTVSYNQKGEISGQACTSYDEQGNQIRVTYLNPDGSCSRWVEREFDSDGHQTLYQRFDSLGTLESGWRAVYDRNGNLMERTWFGESGNIQKITYEWTFLPGVQQVAARGKELEQEELLVY